MNWNTIVRRRNLPNLLTFLNLTLGIVSILEAISKDHALSSLCILLAAFLDRYDGRLARLLGAETDFGRELDSLADLISFGVAPAILLYLQFDLESFPALGTLLPVLYCISAAYRLARHNTSAAAGCFTGVPVTAAGAALAALAFGLGRFEIRDAGPILLLLAASSWLMACRLRVRKF